ncbi:DNA ligase/mRNA capping enzyme, partial [Exidia glandulosa HHB12029]
SDATYIIKRTGDCYRCECMAWRTAGGQNNARSCKHLKELLGEEYENARCRSKDLPEIQPAPSVAAHKDDGGPKSKAKSLLKKAVRNHNKEDKDADEDTAKVNTQAFKLLLANKWNPENSPDLQGWWCSEKLDGVRAFYDDDTFISRLGNPFPVPDWFLAGLPKDVQLDGELFTGRGNFKQTVSIVRTKNSPNWEAIRFHVFDIPSHGAQPFEKRLELLGSIFGKGGSHACDHVVVVKQTLVKDRDHVLEMLQDVEAQGGEGLMLRKPKSIYVHARSATLLKVKTFHDAEARVTGHSEGKGKYQGLCGALICEMESGKTFKCGSGLTDKDRESPPAVGSIIVYRFQELTLQGRPRFPTFVSEAADKTEPKDADLTKAVLGDGEDVV